MSKIHPIHRLIHALESPEKAYFKRFGFKKESKNNDSLKRLFDLIDKQDNFDIDKLSKDKKVNDKVKAHLHVNLNYLQKRIIQSLLDYKRESDELALIFESILEFKIYKEKKLFTLAANSLKSIHKMVLNNDYFLLKPYIKQLPIELDRLQELGKIENKYRLLDDFEYSLNDFSALSRTQMVGLKIEYLIAKNGGTSLKYDEDKYLAKGLLDETNSLVELNKQDFQLRSILANNQYILTLMVGKWQDFESISTSLVDAYQHNIEHKTVAKKLYDFLVVLVNLSFFSLNFGDKIYKESLLILKRDKELLEDSETKKMLVLQIHVLDLLDIALYRANTIKDQEIEVFVKIFEKIDETSGIYTAYLRQLGLIRFKRGEYKKLLDETSPVIHTELKGGFINVLRAIRLMRALAWLKLENISLFDNEIQYIYRNSLELDKDNWIRQVVSYIKRLNGNLRNKEKKVVELKKLQTNYNNLLEANKVSEYVTLKIYMELIQFEFDN